MTGRLFVHIGPPKTATTSLQVALEALSNGRYRYLGVFQPRTRNADNFSNDLHLAVNGAPEETLTNNLEQIRKQVSDGDVVMVSEEMLSLKQGDASTKLKIKRICRIMADIPTTILMTIRDPEETLPSLYQELYPKLPLALKLNFSRYCYDDRTACLDYLQIEKDFAAHGLFEIRWLDFRALVQGRMTTRAIFGAHDLWQGKKLAIDHMNASKKISGSRAAAIPKVNLRELVPMRIVRFLIERLGLKGTRFINWFSVALRRITVHSARDRSLAIPPKRLAELRASYRKISDRFPRSSKDI